jgi:hypothetical protein
MALASTVDLASLAGPNHLVVVIHQDKVLVLSVRRQEAVVLCGYRRWERHRASPSGLANPLPLSRTGAAFTPRVRADGSAISEPVLFSDDYLLRSGTALGMWRLLHRP